MITIRQGDTGLGVKGMQERLVAHGFIVSTDGDFGPATGAAVARFQRARGLRDDGVAGPMTLAELAKVPALIGTSTTVMVNGLAMPRQRCWPLRALADGRKPVITSRHKIHEPSRPTHYGADLLYRYLPSDPPTKIGDSGRTLGYWIPEETWSIAPADGVVERCGPSPTGMYAWIRHEGGLATGGFHYDRLAVITGQHVKMGDPIGRVNDNPKDNDPDHLHGELYRGGLVGAENHYPAGTLDPECWWVGAIVLPAL